MHLLGQHACWFFRFNSGKVSAGSFTVVATSDSAVTYSITSGALPGGLSLNGSTGASYFRHRELVVLQLQTNYNFTVTATDAESQTASRAFYNNCNIRN
jgi:hypothetical protein